MHRILILTVTLLCLAASPCAAESARVAHVVDGDTLYADMAAGRVKIRLAHVDTPEVGTKAACDAERTKGDAASAFAKQLMPVGTAIEVLPTGRTEKWGRLLANVRVGGVDLATELLRRGLAVPYEGRKKPDWCK